MKPYLLDGTTGQVLSKKSDQNGDAEWTDIEANEVYIGQAENAPESAKLIIENEDLAETAAEDKLIVSATEPTGENRVKKWIRHGTGVEDAEFILNENGEYVEFKPEVDIITGQEVKTGRKRNGKDEYVFNFVANDITVPSKQFITINVKQIDARKVKIYNMEGSFSLSDTTGWVAPLPSYFSHDNSCDISCNVSNSNLVIVNNSKNAVTINIDVDFYYTK